MEEYQYIAIPLDQASCIIAHLFVQLEAPCENCPREDGVICLQGIAYDESYAKITIKNQEVRFYGKQRTLEAIRETECRASTFWP